MANVHDEESELEEAAIEQAEEPERRGPRPAIHTYTPDERRERSQAEEDEIERDMTDVVAERDAGASVVCRRRTSSGPDDDRCDVYVFNRRLRRIGQHHVTTMDLAMQIDPDLEWASRAASIAADLVIDRASTRSVE